MTENDDVADIMSGLAAFADAVASCPSEAKTLSDELAALSKRLKTQNADIATSIEKLLAAINTNSDLNMAASTLTRAKDRASRRAGYALMWALSHRYETHDT